MPNPRLALARRLAGFSVIPLISAIIPLIVLPSLTRALGAQGWGALAVGQSLGIFAMTLVASGWGTAGPPMFARLDATARAALYRASFTSRLLLFLPTVALTGVIAYLLAPPRFGLAAGLMAPAFGVWALGGTWYFIASGHPMRIALSDTLPKLAGSVVTVLILRARPWPLAYPISMAVAGVSAVLITAYALSPGVKGMRYPDALSYLKAHAELNLSRLAATAFTSLTTPIIAVVAPHALPSFAAVDRMRTFLATGLSSVSNAFVGWINERMGPREARQWVATGIVTTGGALAGVTMILLGRVAQKWLFSGVTELGFWNLAFQGMAVLLIAVGSTLTFHWLAPIGAYRGISLAGIAGSVVGIAALAVLGYVFGAAGGAIGVAMAEFVVVCVLVQAVRQKRSSFPFRG